MSEPRPSSPARLHVKDVRAAFVDKDEYTGVEITVKMTYDTWCCGAGMHELVDAVRAVYRLFDKYEDIFYDPSKDPLEEKIQKEIDGETFR